jgi:hypothetical protein
MPHPVNTSVLDAAASEAASALARLAAVIGTGGTALNVRAVALDRLAASVLPAVLDALATAGDGLGLYGNDDTDAARGHLDIAELDLRTAVVSTAAARDRLRMVAK